MTTGWLTLLLSLGVGGNPPDVFTMRNHALEIPIRINEAKRAEIQELELHISTDQGRTWTLVGRAKPDQRAFAFQARGDGLYWFGVCAIDKSGHRDPEDIATAPPALKVLIDTSHPPLQVVGVDRVGEEVQVAWECSDSQADPASLKLEYRPAGAEPTAVWTPVPVTPQINGTYRFRPTHGGAITVRMQITDSTGSPAIVVKDVPAAAAMAFAPPPAASATDIRQTNSVAQPPAPAPVTPLPQMPAAVNPQPAPATEAPPPVPAAPTPPATPVNETPAGPTPLAPLRSAADPAPRPATTPTPDLGTPPAPPSHGSPADIQHVRDKQVAIDFDVDRKGPSGVKKIEVYVTQDDGQTWFRYSESLNANPPLQLDLPGKDGLYGFSMVLYSGVGQTEGPPRPGDAPQFRLLVDRTAPQVVLYEPVLDPAQPNALILRYKAADANLVPGSVAVYWKSRPDQPWQPLATGAVHVSGQFAGVQECSWTLPPDVPNSVYLRVTARDQAGNVGEFVTRDPVTVDLNKPVARFKGVVVQTGLRRP
ncbi:MAG TPA: hypothetical protein VGF55_02945 [Gemmataceae bacterium]|jgi:hypothetical protein